MLPNAFANILVVHVPVRLRALAGIAEPAILHLVGHTVIAKVPCGIDAASGIQRADLEAGFAQRLDRHASAGAGSDHDDVVNCLGHGAWLSWF